MTLRPRREKLNWDTNKTAKQLTENRSQSTIAATFGACRFLFFMLVLTQRKRERSQCAGYGGSIIIALHAASAINYFCHKGHHRRYETSDRSTNSLLLSLLTFGEGWHNNHHHYPNTARAGFFWWEIDMVYYFVRFRSWIGVVWDVREVPERVKWDFDG